MMADLVLAGRDNDGFDLGGGDMGTVITILVVVLIVALILFIARRF